VGGIVNIFRKKKQIDAEHHIVLGDAKLVIVCYGEKVQWNFETITRKEARRRLADFTAAVQHILKGV
jgi:hypothetical protein